VATVNVINGRFHLTLMFA